MKLRFNINENLYSNEIDNHLEQFLIFFKNYQSSLYDIQNFHNTGYSKKRRDLIIKNNSSYKEALLNLLKLFFKYLQCNDIELFDNLSNFFISPNNIWRRNIKINEIKYLILKSIFNKKQYTPQDKFELKIKFNYKISDSLFDSELYHTYKQFLLNNKKQNTRHGLSFIDNDLSGGLSLIDKQNK